ncbi:MAG: lamin tail domain-containing protein, partial [Chthoniobacteraceae bacterium]
MRIFLLSTLLAGASTFTLLADTIVLFDGFDFPSTPGSTETDINLNVGPRQSGTTSTTYTQSVTGNASNDALLEDSVFVGSDVLMLRTIHGSTATQTAVHPDANFAPSLAGQKWSATYVGRLDRGSSAITDAYLAFAVGDQADFVGPNTVTADFGFVVQGNGSWFTFVDNVLPPGGSGGAGTLRSPDLWSGEFTVTITIDETLAQPTARATVVVGTNTFDFGPWNVNFDNATARHLELRANNGSGGTGAGALMDVRVNAFVLTQVNGAAQQPIILTAPVSQSLFVGDPFSLTVSATGAEPLSYQWSLNGTPIQGATEATYGKANAVVLDAGTYTIEVTNAGGTGSTSASAEVSVVNPTSAQLTWEPPGPSNRRTALAISEINYHPETRADGRDLEFIEIYNSNPWVEELDGYRITGDIDFAFPSGASIPAKGRLVLAHVPGDVQEMYGISGVLGPFIGNLANEGGTVRLRKGSGAIVQEVQWNDRAPWPLAADGTGHSLVLVRPSYGESNPHAWAASA